MAAVAPPSLPNQNKLPSFSSRIPAGMPAPVVLLQMCSNFQEVRQVHAQLVVSGLIARPINGGRLLQAYVTVSNFNYALSTFDSISNPDVFAYNTMMRGLILGKSPYLALKLYSRLLLDGLKPDNYTYTFVLKACSQVNALFEGREVHGRIIKAGIAPDTYIHSSLINMYSSSSDGLVCAERVLAGFSEDNTLAKNSLISGYLSQGQVESARKMFDNLVAKDDASWSAMVAGYTKNGMYAEALVIFRKMLSSQVSPNESALVSSLCACANLGALDQGKWIHAYIDRIGARISVTVGTALIDMYAKCGSIENAYEVFRKMPQKDVVSWGAIISGFAIHGRAVKCFELFDDMVAGGIHPNEVIFVGILSACSHAGYVETGYKYFDQMVRLYGIKPSTEHYGCMVDLLGRAGRLAEAEKLITSMPEEPNSVIWGAFLGACRMHSDVRRGNLAFKHLTDLEPTSGDRYKLAGIMFANAGEKENATKIRKIITDNDLETTRGVSSIEIDGVVHEFVAGTINHSRHKEIYRMWERVNRLLEIHELEICIPF
ncbi:pentatricopeptide repeat-containing protein At5g66520-like isoform X1 [Rosa rugosa]|uniref:pentatricopeptide repeat-containing protein At5g66520-like isoform X1 n=1 Tax=Rosa rugosa TaxID=74645 RepID=UPI002B40FF41|nr:pentatricopeptide repeat-containing protein At5g66520-like isoform X1 [Rosa rugosa]